MLGISKLITLLSWVFGFPIYIIMSIHYWITVERNHIHCILEYKYSKHFKKNTIKEYKIKIKYNFFIRFIRIIKFIIFI